MTSAPGQAAMQPRTRMALDRHRFRPSAHHVALAAVLALSAILNLRRLSQNGYGNIFYSAGVKSMLRSLHNFFFVSFDPGGLITIDKPPLGLWLQAASAKLFGFTPLSLLLPEAIVGIVSVLVLYRLLSPRIGGWAAVAGALTLAVFPSFVAISRTNNVDALLILLMILACGAALRAIETGHWRMLLLSGALVGLAFNTKTLAAWLVIPGIAAGHLVCAPGTVLRRLAQLLLAGLVMLAVSFSWMAVVELTPASERPFIGSSTDNTELGLTFSYNGIGRVSGQVGGPGHIPVGAGGVARSVKRTRPGGGAAAPVRTAPSVHAPPTLLPNGRAKHPIAFGGPIGPLRLFGVGLGDQGAWMLPFALAGLIALALILGAPQAPERRERADRRLALLLVLGGWFLTEAAVLSLSKGIVHPYYVSALGPGVGAMVGSGFYAFSKLAARRDRWLLLFACAVAASVPVQLSLLHKANYMSWFTIPLIVGALVGLGALALRRTAPLAVALTLGVLLIAPTAYSATNWLAPVQSTFPAAGPRQAAGPGGYGVDAKHLDVERALAGYVLSHRPGRRWAVLVDASNTGSPLILLGVDAGSLGGFSGTDPALDGAGLARRVERGEARYVLLGGEFSTRGGTAATIAVQRSCPTIHTSTWLPRPLSPNGLVLFDCAGRARELAAS